jgi:hypothetical protein
LVVGPPLLVEVGGFHLIWWRRSSRASISSAAWSFCRVRRDPLALSITAAFIAENVRGRAGGEPWPNRSGICAGPAVRPSHAPRHPSAGAPRDRAAADQPVPQPDQNSSLAVVIGYPELVSVFMGGSHRTGRRSAIGITMAVYLAISLLIRVHELVQPPHRWWRE